MRIISVIILFLSVAATGYAEDIRVKDAEAQFSGMRPDTGAVFMKIENKGEDDNIIGAKTDIPGVIVELHDVKDGAMFKVERISLPGGKTIELKRGSFHIMLYNLPLEIKEGDEFTLTLILEKSGQRDVKVKFKKGHMHHH